MPYVIQSTYRQDYTLPNVDRYNISKEYEMCIKEDAEAQKRCIPLDENIMIDETKPQPEWSKLERMELILHRKLFKDLNGEHLSQLNDAISKPNKFTQKINKELCVRPTKADRREFLTTYTQDYPDLISKKRNQYDDLTTQGPLQYKDLGNIIVPPDFTIADYTKTCAQHRDTFVAGHRNEISDVLPSGKCQCSFTEYQNVIGSMGAILKKKKPDEAMAMIKEKKKKKGKRTCGW